MDMIFTAPLVVSDNNFNREKKNASDKTTIGEAAFFLAGENSLQINTGSDDDRAIDYLTHAVTRIPGDLLSHVLRINLYLKNTAQDGSFGALLDLFIALNKCGRPLRKRMLSVSKPVLDEKQYQFLIQRIDCGITAIDKIPPSRFSVLAKGHVGTIQLVRKYEGEKDLSQDPLDEANGYLEYSQIDEAQQVLEKAILDNPSRTELYQDLIDIYRRKFAREPFLMMQKQLSTCAASPPDAWLELESLFAGINRD